MNFLAISVGNSRTRFGTFLNDELSDSKAVVNANFHTVADQLKASYRLIADDEMPVIVTSSTSAPILERIMHEVGKLQARVVRVDKDLPIPIGRQLDREAIVGEDRLLNAAAAYDVLRQACVIVDAGTAITVDFVDGAGTFHGGAIAPGANLMLDSLARGTAQLPEVPFARPLEPLGHNTLEAMRTGVFHAMRGLVRELTEQYAEIAGAYPMVVATGGDAEALFEGFELVERIVPDLTLMGMRLTVLGPKEASDEQ